MAENTTIEWTDATFNPWLDCFSFPFWVTVNRIRRGVRAMRDGVSLVTHDELIALTEHLDEHPEGWDHPCNCGLCRSYGDVE